MTGVFVVGALHLDVVVDAPRLPVLDETLIGSGVAYRFGGKGGNQALATARMGATVAMAGRVGDDTFAGPVLAALDRAGVDRSQVWQGPGDTGMSVAIVEPGGEYGAVVVSGVNRLIQPDEVDPGEASVVLLQNEIPEAVNLHVARRAASAQVILNAAPAREASKDLLAAVDVLVVNRIEAAQMVGAESPDIDPGAAAKRLAALGLDAVIVTLGAEGGVIWDGQALTKVAPPTRSHGSAHGAGDSFVGALAAELARAQGLAAAVRFATCAAAHFVQTAPDAREDICRKDVEAWVATT